MRGLGNHRSQTSSSRRGTAQSYATQHAARFVQQLQSLVRIPSISSEPSRAADVQSAARWLAQRLTQIGLEHVRIVTTPRHPLVIADWLHAPHRPTVLLYGHFDVQPVTPINAWHTPPFSAIIREGNILGRGSSDNKGQLLAHVAALESLLKTDGRLPVNVRCLFDGEEEIGSPSLPAFLTAHRSALRSNFGVVSDTRMRGPDRPALTLSLRGSLALELTLSGPRRDLHSGTFGGAVLNPIQALAEILARMHNARGEIAIPGFYDEVHRYSQGDRRELAQAAPTDRELLEEAGVRRSWGEAGFSMHERTSIRPALTFNGITGGHQGPGVKSIIPAQATARISFRLVANQDPRAIERRVHDYLRQVTPRGMRLAVRTISQAHPVSIDRNHPALAAAARAYAANFGNTPVSLRSGGTIPAVSMLQHQLRLPMVLMGFGLPNDRIHSANERFEVNQYHRAISTCIRFYQEIAKLDRTSGVRP